MAVLAIALAVGFIAIVGGLVYSLTGEEEETVFQGVGA